VTHKRISPARITSLFKETGVDHPEDLYWRAKGLKLRPYKDSPGTIFHPSKRTAGMELDDLHREVMLKEAASPSGHILVFPHCNLSQAAGTKVHLGVARRITALENNSEIYQECRRNLTSDLGRLKKVSIFKNDLKARLLPYTFPKDLYVFRNVLLEGRKEWGGISLWDLDIALRKDRLLQAIPAMKDLSSSFFTLRLLFFPRGEAHLYYKKISDFRQRIQPWRMVGEDARSHLDHRGRGNLVVWQGYFTRG